MRIRSAALIFLASACLAGSALAGPPLITDDPETLQRGNFELNTAYTLNLSGRGENGAGRTWDHETPLFDLNYGLTDAVQLKFEVPFVILDPSGDQAPRGGLGDLSLGGKFRLFEEKESGFGLSTYPALGVPTGTSSQELGTGGFSFALPVQIGKHFFDDKLFVYADGGYERQFVEGRNDQWSLGIAGEYEVREGLVLCAELRHDFGGHNSSDDSLFQVGFKLDLTDHAALIAAGGRSFNPSADSGSDFLLYVGIQWSF